MVFPIKNGDFPSPQKSESHPQQKADQNIPDHRRWGASWSSGGPGCCELCDTAGFVNYMTQWISMTICIIFILYSIYFHMYTIHIHRPRVSGCRECPSFSAQPHWAHGWTGVLEAAETSSVKGHRLWHPARCINKIQQEQKNMPEYWWHKHLRSLHWFTWWREVEPAKGEVSQDSCHKPGQWMSRWIKTVFATVVWQFIDI